MNKNSWQESSDGQNKGSTVSFRAPETRVKVLEYFTVSLQLLNSTENAQVHQNLKDHQIAQHTGIVEVLEKRGREWVGFL